MKPIVVFQFIIALAVCFSASAFGVLFMSSDAISGWYSLLQKPPITPPNWVFGPVWTLLYIMMSVSIFNIWSKGLSRPGVKLAISVFLLQLALNALWTPVFFGFHKILAALIVIALLFFAILATLFVFRKISIVSALLLVPYLFWVGFATILNAMLWNLNR